MSTLVDDRIGELERENAALRRKLADCAAERDGAVAQQTATAEVLQVINASPGDLAPVFEAVLEKAIRLCGAAYGTLRTYDGEVFHLAATRGETDYVDATWQFPTIRPSENNSLFSVFVNGQNVRHIGNALESEEYQRNPLGRP